MTDIFLKIIIEQNKNKKTLIDQLRLYSCCVYYACMLAYSIANGIACHFSDPLRQIPTNSDSV